MTKMENAIKLEMELMTTDIFCRKLITVIEKKEPFSFIRLGDGEGALLSLDEDSTFYDIKYLSEHFGLECKINEALEVKEILLNTILDSDIVGVRSDVVNVKFTTNHIENTKEFLDNFKNAFHLRNVDRDICYADARRISMLHKNVSEIDFLQSTEFVCASIGWDAYPTGALAYILSKQKKIGIISARKGLDKIISNAFGIEVVQYHIPDKFELVRNYNVRHFPDIFNRLVQEINVESPGMVFLVAGGIVGKGYCQVIKKNGGIALDLGAIVDAWAGMLSRPLPLKERYKLKKSWKFKLRKKMIPWFYRSYDLPNELIMTKDNVDLLIDKWKVRSSHN